MRVMIEKRLVSKSLDIVREIGERDCEAVVLWLGSEATVRAIYVPKQHAESDYFWIPPDEMRAIMKVLREKRMKIIAQVHTHPGRAFHSAADDKWAVVQHKNALSLVIPFFARRTDESTFGQHAAVYCLDETWNEAAFEDVLVII